MQAQVLPTRKHHAPSQGSHKSDHSLVAAHSALRCLGIFFSRHPPRKSSQRENASPPSSNPLPFSSPFFSLPFCSNTQTSRKNAVHRQNRNQAIRHPGRCPPRVGHARRLDLGQRSPGSSCMSYTTPIECATNANEFLTGCKLLLLQSITTSRGTSWLIGRVFLCAMNRPFWV